MADSCSQEEKSKNMMACSNPEILKRYSAIKGEDPRERCFLAATKCKVVGGKDGTGGKRRRRRKSRRSRKSKRKSRRKKRKSKKRKTRRRRRRRK